MSVTLLRADARALPLADSSVDLIVTSPPYFGLRSYQDGGKHYTGQVGDEATPAEFVDALIECTREMVRVLKPSGSIWVNLGDKYASSSNGTIGHRAASRNASARPRSGNTTGVATKSLLGIPWRYAIRCIDDLGLILRAEVIWAKPNGLPESVTDRVRRSHETWFHLTKEPRYYSSVDAIREEHAASSLKRYETTLTVRNGAKGTPGDDRTRTQDAGSVPTLGKLPGSVWTVATEPLRVPDELGVDHFAAFPTEMPRRIIQGWSPRGVCVECGEGRRPVVTKTGSHREGGYRADNNPLMRRPDEKRTSIAASTLGMVSEFTVTGEACACLDATAPTTPGVVLDPFGGTGTTALCADVLGRHGISVDMSADYLRIAQWRTTDPKQRAKAARTEHKPPAEVPDGQATFDLDGIGA